MTKTKAERFILLPPRGLISDSVTSTPPVLSSFLHTLETVRTATAPARALVAAKVATKMKVLDSIAETGAKLVEMSPEDVADLQTEHPGLRIVPEVFYYPHQAPRPEIGSTPKAAAAAVKIAITVVSKANGKPVAGATVVAFTDYAQKVGDEGTTDKQGRVRLTLGGASKKVERLYIYAEHSFWSALLKNVMLKSGTQFPLLPIDLSLIDELHFFYGTSDLTAGNGVKVGVIDTGIAVHPDLKISGGQNTVVGENPNDFGDNGKGHGTHVAGMIAARGSSPNGVRGLAPSVELRSYRVFGKNAKGASNFAISKAINVAVAEGCDLINMSLGGGDSDEATRSAIAKAREHGVLVLASSGNDGRQPVSFPANDPRAVAVSALGRTGTYPSRTVEVGEVMKPFGADTKDYIAAFSNVGPEILLTGPGVGIISTFPGNTYAVMDGTSMACPAVTGAAANTLSANPALLAQARDQSRSDAMLQAILSAARTLGFPGTLEGKGLIKI
jgi:subtilisin